MTPDEPSSPAPTPARRKIIPVQARPAGELNRMVMADQMTHDAAELQRAVERGAHWFYWVAALSVINTIIAFSGGRVTFLAGLAISQIVDAFASHLGVAGPYFGVASALVCAFFVCAFGYFAARGSRVALITGMVLYALDGVIFVLFGAIAPALFHAFVLFRLWQGVVARRKLDALRAESPALAAAEGRTLDPGAPQG